MLDLYLAHPLYWFLTSTIFFYITVQQSTSKPLKRKLFEGLHILSAVLPALLTPGAKRGKYWSRELTFLIFSTIHTTSLLIVRELQIKRRSDSSAAHLRRIYRAWSNIRHLPPAPQPVSADTATTSQSKVPPYCYQNHTANFVGCHQQVRHRHLDMDPLIFRRWLAAFPFF